MRLRFKILLIFFITLNSNYTIGFAQNTHHCGQSILTEKWFAEKPEAYRKYLEQVERTKSLSQNHHPSINNRGEIKYTIPVVFHVLHQDGPENISYEQIEDQIRILNIDYQKKNADTIDVVPQFKDIIADVGFEFKLAEIDPNGNCTNGVTRHYTKLTNWDANNLDNFIYSWPREKYLNIYVVKTINIAATAYAFLPGVPVPPSGDVVVSNHDMVGSIGTGTIQNSWVLTHEVGHWFGLPHIWGISNAPGVACGDDFVEDTPITKGFTHCNTNATRICNPAIHENIQNYMDYSPCKCMFTNGQKDYMYGTILSRINGRDNVVSESNHIATGIKGNNSCSTLADFYTTKSTVCIGDTLRFVNLSQPGSNDYTMKWEFLGGSPTESTDSVVNVAYNFEGEYEVKLTVTSANGTKTLSRFVKVNDGNNGVIPTRTYSFEEENIPSEINNYNVDEDEIKWEIYEGLGANNTNNCIYLNNIFAINGEGNIDYFETPFFDLTNVDKPIFSFYYAYAKKYGFQNDSFRIEYSADCGATWLSLPSIPTPGVMANTSGGITEEAFIPTDAQWKKVNLTSLFRSFFRNKPSVKFRFYFKSDAELDGSNNIYLDEINIIDEDEINTATTEFDESSIEVYPNPSNGNFTISLENVNSKVDRVELISSVGKVIHISKNNIEEGNIEKYVANDNLPSGIYLLKVGKGEKQMAKKIFIY